MFAVSRIDERSAEDARPREVCLKVGGIRIALTAAKTGPQLCVAGTMRDFITAEDDGAADISINTSWGNLQEKPCGRLLFDSGSVWKLYLNQGHYEFRLSAPFSGWHPFKIARFNADWTSGEIICERRYFNAEQPVYPLEYPLDEALVSNMLARGRGIEIHGCGLIDKDGQGYLFAGQSGAGKSTMARLWSVETGVRILSDERIILRRASGGGISMHGTPWHGEAHLSSALSAPLNKIFFLARGAHHTLVGQNRTEAAARLFSCSFPPFYSADGLSFSLEFLEQVTSAVRCDELRFTPFESVVDFIRRSIGFVSTACDSGRVISVYQPHATAGDTDSLIY